MKVRFIGNVQFHSKGTVFEKGAVYDVKIDFYNMFSNKFEVVADDEAPVVIEVPEVIKVPEVVEPVAEPVAKEVIEPVAEPKVEKPKPKVRKPRGGRPTKATTTTTTKE